MIAVAQFDRLVVVDRLVPSLHAAGERESGRDGGRLPDLPSRHHVGVEGVAVLDDHGDVDHRWPVLALVSFAPELADITVGDRERARQSRGDCVEGEQCEADRRREQRARILPADRRCGRAGQEPADVA